MIVVLDTTETFSDFRLEGPAFRLLEGYLARTRSELAIPEIVFEETVNHFREQLKIKVASAKSHLLDVDRMVGGKSGIVVPEVHEVEAVENFRKYLVFRIRELGGSVLPYRNVELSKIVSRSLERRQPFDMSGQRGFRDAVLWECVLREVILASKGNVSVALLTRNSKDFGIEPELAPQLRDDFRALGARSAEVRLFNGLQSFVDREVKVELEKLDAISCEVEGGHFKEFSLDAFLSNSTEWVHRAIDDHVRWRDLGQRIPYLSGEFHSQHLQQIDQRPVKAGISGVWRVDDERIAVGVDATFRGQVMFQMRNEEFVPSGNQLLVLRREDPFRITGSFDLRITVILRESSGAVEAHEVDDVQVDFGSENEYRAW